MGLSLRQMVDRMIREAHILNEFVLVFGALEANDFLRRISSARSNLIELENSATTKRDLLSSFLENIQSSHEKIVTPNVYLLLRDLMQLQDRYRRRLELSIELSRVLAPRTWAGSRSS